MNGLDVFSVPRWTGKDLWTEATKTGIETHVPGKEKEIEIGIERKITVIVTTIGIETEIEIGAKIETETVIAMAAGA